MVTYLPLGRSRVRRGKFNCFKNLLFSYCELEFPSTVKEISFKKSHFTTFDVQTRTVRFWLFSAINEIIFSNFQTL